VSDPTVVDVHVHVFERADDPQRDGYDIWEYGEHEGVEFGHRRGTVEDLLSATTTETPTHCVVLGMFVPELQIAEVERTWGDLGEADRTRRSVELWESLPDRLRSYNSWIVETAARSPHLTPLVAADPFVLGGGEGAVHLSELLPRGAKGIKVHPVLQGFFPHDPRMDAMYDLCEEEHLTVLSHSGSTKGSPQWADPFAFAEVMRAHPRLHLLLAHLGGASWHQVAEFAATFPTVSFDICEIIAWTGAPGAPTADELGRLIRDIGADRVLFGTDFPWYELDRTIDQLMSLPHLSEEEKLGILGQNAIDRMGLIVA
jgi:predicted TIM-barrel fold metal-dependent hydrolase